MPAIGYVTREAKDRYTGELRTLSIRAPIAITACKDEGAKPDYRVFADDYELGAGWTRRSSSSGLQYLSLSLAAPEFGPRRIYVDLLPLDGVGGRFALMWIPSD